MPQGMVANVVSQEMEHFLCAESGNISHTEESRAEIKDLNASKDIATEPTTVYS